MAHEVTRLHREQGLRWGDVAVFYRTNAQSRALEEAMVRAEVPYKVVGGTRFYDRREVKDVMAYLRVLVNPDDEVSWRRIVNVPKRGVGETSVARLAGWAGPAWGVVRRGGGPGRRGRGRRARRAAAWPSCPPSSTSCGAEMAIPELVGRERRRRRPRDLDRPAASDASAAGTGPTVAGRRRSRRTAGRPLGPGRAGGRPWSSGPGTAASSWPRGPSRPWAGSRTSTSWSGWPPSTRTLAEFLEAASLVADSDELDGDGTRVSLMTMHIAKGLEFPAVFLVGHGGRDLPPSPLARGPGGARGGAAALLRRDHPGRAAPVRLPRLEPDAVREHEQQHPEPVPQRDPRRAGPGRGRDSRWTAPRRAGADSGTAPAGDDGGTPGRSVFGRGVARAEGGVRRHRAPAPAPASTGAELLGLEVGDRWSTGKWGEGTVLETAGAGEDAEAVVQFAIGRAQEAAAADGAAQAGLSPGRRPHW